MVARRRGLPRATRYGRRCANRLTAASWAARREQSGRPPIGASLGSESRSSAKVSPVRPRPAFRPVDALGSRQAVETRAAATTREGATIGPPANRRPGGKVGAADTAGERRNRPESCGLPQIFGGVASSPAPRRSPRPDIQPSHGARSPASTNGNPRAGRSAEPFLAGGPGEPTSV
jgi:hypothetical protein